MKKPEFNWTIVQGSTEAIYFRPKQPNGDPFDFTGYSARMHVRTSLESADVVIELTTANGGLEFLTAAQMADIWGEERRQSGWMRANLTSSQAGALAAGSFVYDVELVSGTYVRPAMGGKLIVEREVTRA